MNHTASYFLNKTESFFNVSLLMSKRTLMFDIDKRKPTLRGAFVCLFVYLQV